MAIDFKPKAESTIDFQPKKQVAPTKERSIGESIFKRPLERLVLEPARRTGEAIGAAVTAPFLSEEQKARQQEAIEQDVELEVPLFGKFKTRGVQSGVEGAKQIAGEALESAAFLVPPAKIGPIISSTLGRGALTGGITGVKAGGLFGAGEALQEGGDVLDVAKGGAIGAGAGLAAGATLGAALPLVPAALQASKAGIGALTTGVGKAGSAVRSGVRTTAEIPARILSRTAESVTKAGERATAIRKAVPHVGEAMKQGIDDTTIKFVRTGTKADKAQRAQMLEIAKKAKDDLTFMDTAKRLSGDTILKGPVKHLINTADKGRSATKSVLNKLSSMPQNVRNIHDSFVSDMQQLGLKVLNNQIVVQQGSKVPRSDVRFYQEILDDLRLNKKGEVHLTYEQLHGLRQKWFEVARSDETFTSGVTKYAQHIRSSLGAALDTASKGKYMESQNLTRETLTGIQEFVKLIGYKGKLADLTSKDLKAGETFLRVFGNASDRPLTVLNTVYDTASKYGYKGKENIISQLRFADMLEAIYGVPSRSIGGQISRATQASQDPTQVAASSIREMVKWSPYSGAIRFLRARGFLGKREQDVLKAFEKLILGEAGKIVGPKPSPIGSLKESLTKIGKGTLSEGKEVLESLKR